MPSSTPAKRLSVPWLALWPGVACLSVARGWQSEANLTEWGQIFLSDALVMVRLWVVLLMLAWLFDRWSRGVRRWALSTWMVLCLTAMAALDVYFAEAGVPLGSDLFAYTWSELATTVSGAGLKMPWPTVLAWALGCTTAWILLLRAERRPWRMPAFAGALTLAVAASVASPWRVGAGADESEIRQANKLAHWLHEVWSHLQSEGDAMPESTNFPFERVEATPDTLGPFFSLNPQRPPHIVLVVVEGLGRSFSGPGARLGSFTPFLDRLAERSLYWANFLATQGRTFAVLPSLLSSLPFGPHGETPKPHHSLPAWLKKNGYVLRYFTGTNLAFDHQGDFLSNLGFDSLWGEQDFGLGATKVSEWGYADADLMAVVANQPWPDRPTLTLVQTMSMHSPFWVTQMQEQRDKARAHMQRLGLTDAERQDALKHLDVYASVLHTDEALARWWSRHESTPQGRNTILIVTGDHRLPEIPMQSQLERYHVPLLIHSPLLQRTMRIKSVSSHFDVAPTFVALLSHRYGWPSPDRVHWMGNGLDLHPQFRHLHALPLKQTKTELVDYVSGEYVLHRDRLLSLQDGLLTEPVEEPIVATQLRQSLASFKAKSKRAQAEPSWVAQPSQVDLAPYVQDQRSLHQGQRLAHYKGLAVSGLRLSVDEGAEMRVSAWFNHSGDQPSAVFVPLLVVTNASGQEVAERSGPAMRLRPGESREVALNLRRPDLTAGAHFASLVVSHPDSGKPIGRGLYHVAIRP